METNINDLLNSMPFYCVYNVTFMCLLCGSVPEK